MTLDDLIKIANSEYGDDLISRYYEARKEREEPPKDDIGDTLAKFIVIELCETFDGAATDKDQLSEAARVMNSAMRQVGDVADAFENALYLRS
jgi:hypothetical protein